MNFDIAQAKSPGLLRRLAATLYDLLLLFGVLVVAAAVVVIPYLQFTASPFPHQSWCYRLYLLAVICGFYVFPWVKGGQTLGMRAWRFRVLRDDGGGLHPRDALSRLLWATVSLAPAGAGLLWLLIDREGLAWHDRLSHTRLVMVKRTGADRRDAAAKSPRS
jgi:uncharacterized RDD family membrane protein YckC